MFEIIKKLFKLVMNLIHNRSNKLDRINIYIDRFNKKGKNIEIKFYKRSFPYDF